MKSKIKELITMKTCTRHDCNETVVSPQIEYCTEECRLIVRYREANKAVSDRRLNALIVKYTNVNHLQINSSTRAYNEAIKL